MARYGRSATQTGYIINILNDVKGGDEMMIETAGRGGSYNLFAGDGIFYGDSDDLDTAVMETDASDIHIIWGRYSGMTAGGMSSTTYQYAAVVHDDGTVREITSLEITG